jgi:hypothetical protein
MTLFPIGDNNPIDVYPTVPSLDGTELIEVMNKGTGKLYVSLSDMIMWGTGDYVSVLDFIPQSEHAAIRARTSTLNVTAYFQAALNTGYNVWAPSGRYNVTTLSMVSPGQKLFGDGVSTSGTRLVFSSGALDALTIGVVGTQVEGFCVRDLYMDMGACTGGDAIKATQVKYFILDNVTIDTPYQGVEFVGGLNIVIRDVVIRHVRSGFAIKASGTDAVACNIITIWNFNCSPVSEVASGRATGILVDGNVNTIDMYSVGCIHMGRGLHVRNTVGATNLCQFINSHSFQADYPEYEAIRIEVGEEFFFQNYYTHGSALADGIYIAPGVGSVGFGFGWVTGHALNGMNLNGNAVMVNGSVISRNSLSVSNTYDGILVGALSNGTVITNSMIGRHGALTGIQRYGVNLAAGATQVLISSNNMDGNVTGDIHDGGSVYGTLNTSIAQVAGDGLSVFRNGNGEQFAVGGAGAAIVNRLRAFGGATGAGPGVIAEGTDTNINVRLLPKGTGEAYVGSRLVYTAGGTTHVSIADGGTSAATAQGACANLGVERIIGNSSAGVAHTGDILSTVVATVTIPAGAMGANGYIVAEALWSAGANNANAKTCAIRFGGTVVSNVGLASQLANHVTARVSNRTVVNSQVAQAITTTGWGNQTTGPVTSAENTANAVDVTFTIQLGVNTDTVTLESYLVKVYYAL